MHMGNSPAAVISLSFPRVHLSTLHAHTLKRSRMPNDSILVMLKKLVQAVSRGRESILLVYWLRWLRVFGCACYGCMWLLWLRCVGCVGCVALVMWLCLVVVVFGCGCVVGSHAGKKDTRKKDG